MPEIHEYFETCLVDTEARLLITAMCHAVLPQMFVIEPKTVGAPAWVRDRCLGNVLHTVISERACRPIHRMHVYQPSLE